MLDVRGLRRLAESGNVLRVTVAGGAMQGDPASTNTLRGPLGYAIDRGGSAGGAYQICVVSICADQGQGFLGAVLLYSLSSHVDGTLRWKVDIPPDSTIF